MKPLYRWRSLSRLRHLLFYKKEGGLYVDAWLWTLIEVVVAVAKELDKEKDKNKED